MKRKNTGLGFFSTISASFEESWAEVKVNKARIFFSLFGVFIAVLSLATILGAGNMLGQHFREDSERQSGKNATLSVYAHSGKISRDEFVSEMEKIIQEYQLYATTRRMNTNISLQFQNGVSSAFVTLYDYQYGLTRNVLIQEGRWFNDTDVRSFVPRIIIDEASWKRLGSPDLSTYPTIEMVGTNNGLATIIGVTPGQSYATEPIVMMLYDDYTFSPWETEFPEYQMWVEPEIVDELQEILQHRLNAFFGYQEGSDTANNFVQVGRTDAAAYGGADPFESVTIMFSVIALIVLIIGGVGILNIALVTIKQRVHEIGIRRSFGATSTRIFFTVMMESVVATGIAGMLGIILSIAILRNEYVFKEILSLQITNIPAYPLEAALISLLAAVTVGFLAGLIPAIYAVRVKVIDAIRL